MSGDFDHEWNVVIVEKFDYPMVLPKEFQVRSKSLLGASMKAKNIITNKYPDWKIKSLWYLDPKRLIRS